MCWKSVMAFGLLLATLPGFAAETPEKRSYQTFVADVQAGRVKSIEIPSGFRSDYDIVVSVFQDDKETTYVVDRPYRADEDPIFLDFLKTNQIEYKLVETDDDMGFLSSMGIFPALLVLGPPIVMFILLIVSVKRTGRIEDKVYSIEHLLTLESAKDENRSASSLPSVGPGQNITPKQPP